MSRRAAAGAILALLAAAAPLTAQQVRLRLGGIRARYADSVTGTGGVFTTRLSWDGPRVTGDLDGTFTQFTTRGWAAQGAGSVFGVKLLSSHVGVGVRADGDAGYLQGGDWSALGAAGPVAALVTGDWLYTAGITMGGVRRVDRLASVTFGASFALRRDVGPFAVQGGVTATRAGQNSFADASLAAQFRSPYLTLGVLAGARTGNLGGPPWYQGDLQLKVTTWATLEADAGSYPRDLSGFTSGAFISIGAWIRVGPERRTLASAATSALFRAKSSSPGIGVESLGPGRQRLTFLVPGAHDVAIAGEWNDWIPVALQRVDGGHWRVDLALGQGAHRFSLVVDGHRWIVPPGVATLPDDMGGQVGLLVIDQ